MLQHELGMGSPLAPCLTFNIALTRKAILLKLFAHLSTGERRNLDS